MRAATALEEDDRAEDGEPQAVTGVPRDLAEAIAQALIDQCVFLPALMTVEDTARTLHLEERVVRRWIAQRRIPAAKLGKRWFVPRDALLRHVETLAMRNVVNSDRWSAEFR